MAGNGVTLPQKLRKYKHLPVFIEEDHNEVVPHVHRAIGSRHLPISGIRMVHFDSHPDLLLPLHMLADHVFDKTKLYDELSIENWILPLVYAGHVNEIFWLKPPWADQLPNSCDISFSVGREQHTGEIRVTLKHPYFLTEALYAPESEMTDIKQVTLHVITVTPPLWDQEASTSADLRMPLDKSAVVQCSVDSVCNTALEAEDTEVNVKSTKRHADDNEAADSDSATVGTDISQGNIPSQKARKLSPEYEAYNKSERKSPSDCSGHSEAERRGRVGGTETGLLTGKAMREFLKEKLDGHPYILDIDLDFFSTKDPFKNDYSHVITCFLKDLFGFTLPEDMSDENALEFSKSRKRQLDELESLFKQLQREPNLVFKLQDQTKQKLLDEFMEILQSEYGSHQETVDFEKMFRAGCTFDGSELPHHVSSQQQIQQLMTATANLLKSLPSPTVVTVSRSSIDDFCPQNQVEAIQESMMTVLKDIYTDINIQKHYQQE